MKLRFHEIEVRRRTLARLLVAVFNLVVELRALYSYQQTPPITQAITGPDVEEVVAGGDVTAGKTIFQSNGLANHGSIHRNGA